MALRDILVHVDKGTESARRAAIELAAAHEAHLLGLHVVSEVQFPSYSDARIPEESIRGGAEQARANVERLRETFLGEAGGAGQAADWQVELGTGSQPLVDAARFVDLVVVAKTVEERLSGMPLVSNGELVSECPRPVLVVPRRLPEGGIGDRVAIAWDGGRKAVRAVAEALPLLARARRVALVAINPAEGDDSARAMREHLARHGIEAELRRIVDRGADTATALVSATADLGADLVVMGAYGRARLREIILGGTTRDMLRATTVPVLMAH